jgi:multidrug efflux pump subunit AcrB
MDQPTDESDYTIKWDGEWQITLDVFRDLGIAFGVAIVIIYMLIVGWFQNFKTPIVMMLGDTAIVNWYCVWTLVIRGLFHGNFFHWDDCLGRSYGPKLGFTD